MKIYLFSCLKITILVFILFVSNGCKSDEPTGPSCKFDPAGINVGYSAAYFQRGGVAAGGIDVCEYARAGTWQLESAGGFDSHFPGKKSGQIFRIETSVNPVFASCPEVWVKIHSDDKITTGKRYTGVAWVRDGACFNPNTTGWVELTEYDEVNQSVSGKFYAGDDASRSAGLNEIRNAVFKDVPLNVQ